MVGSGVVQESVFGGNGSFKSMQYPLLFFAICLARMLKSLGGFAALLRIDKCVVAAACYLNVVTRYLVSYPMPFLLFPPTGRRRDKEVRTDLI